MTRGGALCLWAAALLLTACSPQSDLVGLLGAAAPPAPPACEDPAGCPNCGAADSCSDPRCADAEVCQVEMPHGECSGRSCLAAASRVEFCSRDGSAVALGDTCASETANPRFSYALCVQEELVTQGALEVNGDVAVDGDTVNFEGDTVIRGALRYSDAEPQDNGRWTAERTERTEPSCVLDGALAFDLDSAVEAHRNEHDNTLAPAAFASISHFSGDQRIELPCGRYYVTGVEGNGALTLHALGHVALFVDGNVQLERGFQITTEPGARVSVIVRGAFHVLGGFLLGAVNEPRHVLAVGGQLHLEGEPSKIGGVLYVPASDLLSAAPLEVAGAVFVKISKLNDTTVIRYAPEGVFAADGCSVE
ncbi:MAG: hypothetical protein ABW321_29065 [Polyangiales bacterium]